jgi:hypothetical protein
MSSNVGSANDSFAASGSSPQIGPDFFVENHGSIFLLRPVTAAGFAWVSEHIPEDAQSSAKPRALNTVTSKTSWKEFASAAWRSDEARNSYCTRPFLRFHFIWF